MATLILAENPGKWRRRCDATCHRAKKPKCNCICGGRYHGKANDAAGLAKAIRETSDGLLNSMICHYAADAQVVDTSRLVTLRSLLHQGQLNE